MSNIKAELIADKLKSRDLLASWLQFGPDGERINMVLMKNTNYKDESSQIHFAHCIYNGNEVTPNCPSWIREAIRGDDEA